MDKMKERGSLNGVRVVRGAGRKDRHSKVCTARGTRDRRVRLSPKTAILFYDVQERLGCDRPSKAIDWLMKEAKAAIDALDVQAPAAPADCNRSAPTNAGDPDHQQMVKFECANDDDIPIQGLGFFNGGEAPPCFSPELQARAGGSEAEQFLSAPTPTSLDLFDANSEVVRMQRILSWNYADAAGVDFNFNYPAAADFHVFAEREPLQSSYSKMKSNSAQFQGFGFPDQELLNFKVDEIINPFLNKSSSTASFLPTL